MGQPLPRAATLFIKAKPGCTLPRKSILLYYTTTRLTLLLCSYVGIGELATLGRITFQIDAEEAAALRRVNRHT